MFERDPLCEVCGKGKAEYFICFREEGSKHGNWTFTCMCQHTDERYCIPMAGFFGSPTETTNWLLQLHEKTWMDWNGFMDMLTRLRKACEPPLQEE